MPTPCGTGVDANWLLYDGECPFCSSYVKLVKLRESIGPVTLADAREHADLVSEVRRQGYDVNSGMVLKLDGQYYHGADCIHALAMLTTTSGWFNRMNRTLFRSRAFSKIAYPVLRAGRNATLRVLGRRRVEHHA